MSEEKFACSECREGTVPITELELEPETSYLGSGKVMVRTEATCPKCGTELNDTAYLSIDLTPE